MLKKIKNINKRPLLADLIGGGSFYYSTAFFMTSYLKDKDISDLEATAYPIIASDIAYLAGSCLFNLFFNKKEYQESSRNRKNDVSTISKGLIYFTVLNNLLKGAIYYGCLQNDIQPDTLLTGLIYASVDSLTGSARQVYNSKKGLFKKYENLEEIIDGC